MLDILTLPSIFTEDAFHVVTDGVGIGWPSVFFGPKAGLSLVEPLDLIEGDPKSTSLGIRFVRICMGP